MLLYQYSASQSMGGTWPTTEEIAQKVEGGDADAIATASVIKQLSKAGLT